MKKIIFSILAITALFIGLAVPVNVSAAHPCDKDPGSAICKDECFKDPTKEGCRDEISKPIYGALNTFIILIGIIAVAMIVWSGIRMTIFHNNDTKSWAKARNILVAAVIALVIAALALTIVNLTLGAINELPK